MKLKVWKTINAAEVAKKQGFVFDDEIQVNDETKSMDVYLMATDELMARFSTAFEEKFGNESFKEVSEAIIYNGEVPNFYAFYDMEKDTISDNLVSCAHFAGKDGIDKYMYVDIPLTGDEADLLRDALNEYCIQEYSVRLDYIVKQELARIDYTYDPSFETNKTLEELEAKAEELDDAENRDFSCFNNGELYQLYKVCLLTPENPGGRAYDDEVFDEIDKREYEGRNLIETYKDMYTEETGFEWPERKFVVSADKTLVNDENTISVVLENTSSLMKAIADQQEVATSQLCHLLIVAKIDVNIEGCPSDKVSDIEYCCDILENGEPTGLVGGTIELNDYERHMIYDIADSTLENEYGTGLEDFYRDNHDEPSRNDDEER